MPDNEFELTEISATIQRLLTADSWDSKFHILEQEQTIFVGLEADAILQSIIEQREQRQAPQEEIDLLTLYLILFKDIREIGLAAAWEAFIDALIEDNTGSLVETAFDKFTSAATLEEKKLVFEQERFLLLSETAELLWQRAFTWALQRDDADRGKMIDSLRLIRAFLDLQRGGDDEEAWKLFEASNQQHIEEINNALNALSRAETLEDVRTILEENQACLLTEEADQFLDFLIQDIGANGDDPTYLHFLVQTRDLLLHAHIVGIKQAIKDKATLVHNALVYEQQFTYLLENWLQATTVRTKRRFLEQHLEIVQPHSATLVQNIEADTVDAEEAFILHTHASILNEILQRGGTIQAVRETYVNRTGGFALDLPLWLEEVEHQLETLVEQPSNRITCIQLLRMAIIHAQQDANVAPETLAELQNILGVILRDTPESDPLYAANLEEALAMHTAALQTFTVAHYPYQHAQTQHEVGMSYIHRVEGSQPENLERAIVCYTAALQILNRTDSPMEWALAQINLGEIYRRRIAGDKRHNLEQALACQEAAQEVYQRSTFPMEWAQIQINLAMILGERIEGIRRENMERSIKCCQQALQVYTRDAFPLEWATTHALLGATYTELSDVCAVDVHKEVIEHTLEHYRQAEQILTSQSYPDIWAIIQQGLMASYTTQIDGHKANGLQQAIVLGESALHVLTRESQPQEWAGIHYRLGDAYYQAAAYAHLQALYSGRSAIQEQALRHTETALQVYTPEGNPLDWARAQHLYGKIYFERVSGERNENLARAKHCCESALEVLSREFSPLEWAATQTLLGVIFLSCQDGQKEVIEQAIAYFEASLEVCHRTTYPAQWAMNQGNLCLAYTERIVGDHQQNLEKAIQHGQATCQVYTMQNAPIEWAEAQSNLGTAYVKRTGGERRVNIEKAIACFENAERVFTRTYAPFRWAVIQANLCAIYHGRSEGNTEKDAILSIQYAKNALEVYTEENAPREWALLQFHLGHAYLSLMQVQDSIQDSALLAERHFTMATRAFNNNGDPLNAALTQLRLGVLYQSMAINSGNAVEYKERILTCYHAALTVLTKETTPIHWAVAQTCLGVTYGFLRTNQKSILTEQEQAVVCVKQALTVFTLDHFPYEHRSLQMLGLNIEWQRRNWQEVYRYSEDIYKTEQRLLLTSTGTSGLDKILTKSQDPAAFGAFTLLYQGRIEQAAITLERGRTRNLAQAIALHRAAPERIENLERRIRYTDARQALQQARAALDRMTSLNGVELDKMTSLNDARQSFIDRTTVCETAQRAFDDVVDEIRAARDPADFLEETVNRDTLEQAVALGGSGHTLIYLVALPDVGGFALAVQASKKPADDQEPLRFASCELPGLTSEFVLDLVRRGTEKDLLSLGGLSHAQVPQQRLSQYFKAYTGTETLRTIVAQAQSHTPAKTFLAALESCLQDPMGEPLLDNTWKTLSESELAVLYSKFLHMELRYCQEKLVPVLLHPLLIWLQKIGASSVTPIPCGYLAGLPLTTLLIDDNETLGDKLPTSVAPSARSLLYTRTPDKPRSGVSTFGDPQKNLPWGAAEAYTLRKIASQLQIENHLKMQQQVTSEALFESLQHAQVIDLACHGAVQPGDYLRSCLWLADGQLTLGTLLSWEREMQGLRLLILSACQSAIPDLRGAVEEVRSLTSAMLQAGVCAVLAPLWSVDDRATYLLMTRFAQEWFPRMQTEPPAAALARAQRWLRTVTNKELRHWEISTLAQSRGEAEYLTTEGDLEFPSMTRGHRFDADQAQELIQQSATGDNPYARPYADPAYWAGFQVVGW
jgi:CHAT domain-containing protein/tetratricopeptide (TPR) repeat protein